MYNQRSPPKYKNNYMGGSETSSVDLLSLNSSGSSASLLLDGNKKYCVNYNPQNAHQHHHYYGSRGNRSTTHTAVNSKRNKRHWGNKDRAGMSFLIVIAFFAIFGLIILTEVFMIDERSHAGMISVRHGNTMGRLGDSMPDYDNVKDDYDVLEDNLLSDHKLGYVQMRDNKFKIQEVEGSNGNRVAGLLLSPNDNGLVGAGIGMSIGGAPPANVPIIPWGKVLPGKIEESLPHFPKGMQITDGSWQIVNGTRFKFFVFSAYYDRREGSKLVRVIGATKTRGPERVWCRFWYEAKRNITAAGVQIDKRGNRVTSVTVMARVKVIRENWNLKYSACFVLCPVRSPDLQVPNYISIVSRLRTPPGNLLLVRNTDWDADFTHVEINITQQALHNTTSFASATNSLIEPLKHIPDKIAVCVKPFHFNYDQAFFLMEYLELYTLLGVSHFTFYNHTVGPHAACVLDHYARGDVPSNLTAWDLEPATPAEIAKYKENLASGATIKPPRHLTSSNYVQPTVTILPWNLRMRSQKEIRTEGLFAALNDCVYRSMYRYKYLALVDLDEFIVPRYNDTLKELLDSLNKRFRNRNTGAYSFQNAFFYLQFPDDTLVMQQTSVPNVDPRVRATLVTQRKTKRRFKLHPQKQRSKYICKPEAVIEAGNHFVWEFSPNKGSLNVPPTEAILQHYRVCEFGGNDCIKAPSVVDRTAMKYVNRLVQRVNFVYQHLRGPCKLPELPTARQQDTTEATNTKTMEEAKKSPTEETTTNNELRKTKTSTNAQTINTAEKATLKPDVNKRKRKVVIFEADDTGVMKARVEFSKKIRT